MDILNLLGPAKIIARTIERKFPGSCTTLVHDLEEISNHPGVIKHRAENWQHIISQKWNEVKDRFSSDEIDTLNNQITTQTGQSLNLHENNPFSIVSNMPEDISNYYINEPFSSVSDIDPNDLDITDISDSGENIFTALTDFFSDIFS